MKKTRLDYLLDKVHPTLKDMQEIKKILEEKEKLTEEEKGYLIISKILIKDLEQKEQNENTKR